MSEEEFRKKLDEYLLRRREDDLMFAETKFEGMTFADYHVSRLKRENGNQWDSKKANERINQLYSLGIRAKRKCEHCDNVFVMHAGDNFCEKCQQFTFIPAIETTRAEQ